MVLMGSFLTGLMSIRSPNLKLSALALKKEVRKSNNLIVLLGRFMDKLKVLKMILCTKDYLKISISYKRNMKLKTKNLKFSRRL